MRQQSGWPVPESVYCQPDRRDLDCPSSGRVLCAKQEKKLPVVLSPEEVSRFFAAIHNFKHRVILMTAYGADVRISKAVNLRATDIDRQRMVIRVRQGKNKKDRYTKLSPILLDLLRCY